MAEFTPKPMTEWDEQFIRDCAFASLVMVLNKGLLGSIPTVRASRETLARSVGHLDDHLGATMEDLERAALRVHAVSVRSLVGGTAGLLSSLKPGVGAVVFGWYAGAPKRLQRFDRAFAARGVSSYHAVYVERRFDGTLWWIDPLFHSISGSPGGSYKGDPITETELLGYSNKYSTHATWLPVRQGSLLVQNTPEVDMRTTVTQVPFPGGRGFTIPAGSTINGYAPDKAVPVVTHTFEKSSSGVAVARAFIAQSPDQDQVPHGGPFLLVKAGMFIGLFIVERLVAVDADPVDPTQALLAAAIKARDAAEAKVTAVRKVVL